VRAGRNRPRGRVPQGLEELFRQFEGPEQDRADQGSGSGFIVSRDGYILTNNHVVADADRVTVGLLDKRTFPAKVVGRDETTDIAVLKIEGTNLPAVNFGDDQTARVGQWVLAIGNPLGLDFTVTAGIVSAKGRSSPALGNLLGTQYAIADFIQTDAAINPGNSGGPLVNIRGEVIGVNSMIASQTGFNAGYGFAIPISLARQVMQDLIAHGRVRRAVLGIGITEVTPNVAQAAGLEEIAGVLVGSFTEGESPARRAGLELGDIIIAIDGQKTDRVSTLQRIVRSHKPGDRVKVDAMRFGKRMSFDVRLVEAEQEEATVASGEDGGTSPAAAPSSGRHFEKMGISVQSVPPELAAQARLAPQYRTGLLVSEVSLTGPARNQLIEGRDIIVEVVGRGGARKAVRSAADLEAGIRDLANGNLVTMVVYSFGPQGQGQTRVVTLRMDG
jgi:serine protease Do